MHNVSSYKMIFAVLLYYSRNASEMLIIIIMLV